MFIDLLNAIPGLVSLLLILESRYQTAKYAVRNFLRRLRTPKTPLVPSIANPGQYPAKTIQYTAPLKLEPIQMTDRQQTKHGREYRKFKQKHSHSGRMRRWASQDMQRKNETLQAA